jgi:hypothetical protein
MIVYQHLLYITSINVELNNISSWKLFCVYPHQQWIKIESWRVQASYHFQYRLDITIFKL